MAQADVLLPNPLALAGYVPTTSYTAADAAAKVASIIGGNPVPTIPKENVINPWGVPAIYAPDPLRTSVEQASGGHLTVLYDSAGNPSVMRVIPKFRVEDIHADLGTGVHPAFIQGGVEKTTLFIAAYLASASGTRAVSMPGRDPWNTITFDNAKAACVAKNGGSVAGWHMMTAWEWAAVALWCLKNGFQPRGNTQYGKAHDALHEAAVRGDASYPGDTAGTPRTKTGTGPVSWRHDNTVSGISDLVGNVFEWNDGLKLVDGQFFCPNDNDFSLAEGSWPAQGVYLDSTGTTGTDTAASANGAPVLSNSRAIPSDDCGDGLGASAPDYDYSQIAGESGARSVTMTAGYDAIAAATRQRMMQMLISHKLLGSSSAPFSAKGYIYVRNYGERMPLRGGSWGYGAGAGLAAFFLGNRRSGAGSSVGFRPAYLA